MIADGTPVYTQAGSNIFLWYGSQPKNSTQLSLWEKQLLCVLSLCMLCMIQLWNDGIVKPQEQITLWGKKCQFLLGMFAPSVPLSIYLLSSCSIFLLVSARAHTHMRADYNNEQNKPYGKKTGLLMFCYIQTCTEMMLENCCVQQM